MIYTVKPQQEMMMIGISTLKRFASKSIFFKVNFFFNRDSKKANKLNKVRRKKSEILNSDEIIEYDRLPSRKSELALLLNEIDHSRHRLRMEWFQEYFVFWISKFL